MSVDCTRPDLTADAARCGSCGHVDGCMCTCCGSDTLDDTIQPAPPRVVLKRAWPLTETGSAQ